MRVKQFRPRIKIGSDAIVKARQELEKIFMSGEIRFAKGTSKQREGITTILDQINHRGMAGIDLEDISGAFVLGKDPLGQGEL